MKKIIYIFPYYSEDTATHFYTKREIQEVLRREADFFPVDMRSPKDILRALQKYIVGYRDFYVHYSQRGALLALFLTKLGGGRVFYWHCGMPWLYRRSWWEERIFKFILRHTIFVTGTPKLAEEYQRRYGILKEQTRVVPNWVNLERFGTYDKSTARRELGISENTRVVLFAHHLSRRKGAGHIPSLVKDLRNEPNIFFLIAGAGEEEEVINQSLLSEGLESQVRMLGNVPNQAMVQHLAAADVLIAPSEEEGFPNILLEAMAMSLPFVTFDVGGVSEVIPPESRENVLEAGDMGKFTERVHILLGDPRLRHTLGEVERSWVTRYDIHKVAPQFAALFDER